MFKVTLPNNGEIHSSIDLFTLLQNAAYSIGYDNTFAAGKKVRSIIPIDARLLHSILSTGQAVTYAIPGGEPVYIEDLSMLEAVNV
jgi:hypothetical protein